MGATLGGCEADCPSPSGWNIKLCQTQGVALGYVVPAFQAEEYIFEITTFDIINGVKNKARKQKGRNGQFYFTAEYSPFA